ncbi:antiterminator Q family protein, partial [Escherichia coli]|uniref:antiterminator Q family protein n=1 Tax=Escherichia coli TaxID=562 RepID=UPI003EE03BDC
SKVKSRPQCCDDDAMIICGCMARLKKNNSDLHDLLVDYYVGGKELEGGSAVFGQMLIGNAYSTTPVSKVRFTIAQLNNDTKV